MSAWQGVPGLHQQADCGRASSARMVSRAGGVPGDESWIERAAAATGRHSSTALAWAAAAIEARSAWPGLVDGERVAPRARPVITAWPAGR